jgi:acyl carrier protein
VESAIYQPYREPSASQIITGIPAQFVRSSSSGTFWNRSARFVGLERPDGTATSGTTSGTASVGSPEHTRVVLAAAQTKREASAAIMSMLVTKLATEFGRPKADIDPWMSLTEMGVDSLVAVELRNWITAMLDTECSIFDIMQSSSLSALGNKLVGKSRLLRAGIC